MVLNVIFLAVVIFIARFTIASVLEQQPIFTSQPIDIGPLFSGTRGILQCVASGTPSISYRWLKDNASLTNRSTTNGGVLLISQADRFKDVGDYQCVAENKLGSVLSNKAKLTVAYMDQLKLPYSTEIRVRMGRAAIIKMPKMFDAYPMPTIEWYAGGALIEPNAKFAITKDFNLVVLRCDKADEKSYYVEASSIHTGTKIRSREIRLYILDFEDDMSNQDDQSMSYNEIDQIIFEQQQVEDQKADQVDLEFVVRPQNTVSILNANIVKFDCIVNSRRQPLDQLEINWYKDEQLIDFIKTKYHLSSRSLEIISVTDQDAGTYTCSAKFLYNTNFPNAINNKNAIVSINASAKLDVYIKPTFKTQPENLIETDFGKTIVLKCEGIANPRAVITWYKNAELINFESANNVQLNDSGTKLIISNISIRDQAIYQCFLTNDAGHISASTLLKIISFPPKFTTQIQNRTVYSDSNVVISCGKVDGSPKPYITWSRLNFNKQHNRPIYDQYSDENFYFKSDQNENKYSMSEGDYTIKNVNAKLHEGWYRCEAKNLLGSISADMFLKVNKRTEIIEPPMNISVTKGQSAFFKCTITKEENIDVDIQWRFNDLLLDFEFLPDGSSICRNANNLKLYQNGTLQILEAKNTDIGTYSCIVKSLRDSLAGNDSKTAYLNVVELPYAPVNIQASLNLNLKRSVNLTWDSSFDGNSKVIKYIVHARIVSFDALNNIQTDSQSQRKESEMNDWSVIKDNVFDSSYSSSPSMGYHDVYYQQHINLEEKQESFTQWTILTDLKPAFVYQFRVSAVNGIGEGMPSRSSNNISIPEEVPSQPPQNINAYSLTSRIINVKWQPPIFTSWNGRLRGYQIAYSLTYPNSSWKFFTIEDQTQTSANLTDLIVWENYLIKMCAFNKIGFGKFNEPPLRVRTKEGIPIRAPTSFQANSINSTCMGISWNEPPPQFVNGVIQGFKVVFYENDNYELKKTHIIYVSSLSIQSNHQQNQYFYQMCDLKKFTQYTLSILCFTDSGDGPLTQPIQLQTLEDVPGEVNEISFINVYDKSVDIEWKPPLQPNGKILSYVIMYKPLIAINNKLEKFEKIILDSTQNNFTLRNLKSSTEYVIGIRATTRAGEGVLKLTQIKSGVPPELPEPPRAIVLRTIGQTSVELEFIPGYDGKTSINKWIVEAIILNDEVHHKDSPGNLNVYKWYRVYEKSNAPNITKLTVENLIPFTNYSLRMFSQNVKGRSKPSSPTEKFQTLADIPSQTPSYLSARLNSVYKNTTRQSNINVLIKWSPIPTRKWNGVPLGYIISIKNCLDNSLLASNESRREIKIKFNKFEINSYYVKSLDSFECYIISIAAWNNVGVGPFTPNENVIVLNRTSQSRPSRGPLNVNLYAINNTSIRVVWQRLDQKYANGLLIGYKIKYTPDLVSSSTIQNNLTFLLNETKYNHNYLNYYESKENEEDNDNIYINNLSSKDVYLSLNKKNFKDSQFEIALNSLLGNMNYKIEIAGCTRAGCGEYSVPVSLKTKEHFSSRPIDIKFNIVNLTSIQLEWKQPKYTNGVLKTFRIKYIPKRYLEAQSHNNGENLIQRRSIDTHESHSSKLGWSTLYVNVNSSLQNRDHIYRLNVSGLSKMEYYIFSISANNTSQLGWGSEAKALIYTIEGNRRSRPDPPNKPTISKSSIKTNQLTLNWNGNSENYSPIRYFTIQINEISFKKKSNTIIDLGDYLSTNFEKTLNNTEINYFNFDLNWRTIYQFKITSSAYLGNYRLNINGKDKQGNFILKPNGFAYKFRISATNDVGTSEFSAESDLIMTKQSTPKFFNNMNMLKNDLPIPTNRLNVEVLSTSKININWYEWINLKHLNDNDFLIKFKLVYKLIGLNNKIPQLTNSNQFYQTTSTGHENSEYFDENVYSTESTQVELLIDYQKTHKVFIDSKNSGNISKDLGEKVDFTGVGLIKHEYFIENNYFLDNGTYEFYICGINSIGESKNCILSRKLVYMEDRLPRFDKNVGLIESITPLSSTELNVTWKHASRNDVNGKLLAYKILYFDNEISTLFNEINEASTKKYNSINGHYFNYDSSDYYDDLSSSITTSPSENEIIKLIDSNEHDMINAIIVEPNVTNVIVNNLKPFRNYTCFIKVINQGGEAMLLQDKTSAFKLKMAQTFQSIPSMPKSLIFSYVSYTFLNITWLRPQEPNGKLLAYELWYENVPMDNETNSAKTKIIRQEITVNTNESVNNYTLFINNLESQVNYRFKVRCRTQIDWGPYSEKIIRTGPQGKLAPLPTSKPMFVSLNDSYSLLEWKSYSNDYEYFLVEIKYIVIRNNAIDEFSQNISSYSLSSLSNRSVLVPEAFELFAYSNTTSVIIKRNDKRFQTKSIKNSDSMLTLCIFRISSFNSISISEPSQNSELIHISKLFDNSYLNEKNTNSLFLVESDSKLNQIFYLNWWFLVIIALSSFTILIIIVLIMFLRGKNKKFLMNRKKRMDTLRMIKLGAGSAKSTEQQRNGSIHNGLSDDITADTFSNDQLDNNSIPIYLANSNNNLINPSGSNNLARRENQNGQYTLYDLRKSIRGGCGTSNIYNGSVRTATYISPNGTLSRINVNDVNDNDSQMMNSMEPLIVNGSLIKRQQLNGLNNARNLSNLIGLNENIINHAQSAQPNDYCSSGRIGALLNNNNNKKNSNDNLLNDNNFSDNNARGGHYLIPCNTNSHYVLNHPNQMVQNSKINEHQNRGFKYSSSDAENELQINSPKKSTLNRNERGTSNNKIYTTSSFGRQKEPISIPNGISLPINYEMSSFQDPKGSISVVNSIARQQNKKPQMNMYYEHQQVQSELISQPTYFTHQSPAPQSRLITSVSSTSPFDNDSESKALFKPNIQTAASNTAEALGALANAASSSSELVEKNYKAQTPILSYKPPPLSDNNSHDQHQQHQHQQQSIPVKQKIPISNTSTSISSVPFNGDRIVMNNVAGSRKPLAGFSSFI